MSTAMTDNQPEITEEDTLASLMKDLDLSEDEARALLEKFDF